MKKIVQILMYLIVLMMIHMSVTAQDIMDIPPLDAEGVPALAYTIIGDTTATGERNNPDRIYRLERGGIYVLTATIIADYPLRIIADGDDSQRPPMIVSGKFADGVNIRPFFRLTGDDEQYLFKDLMFNGVDLDRLYDTEWIKGLVFEGDNMSITFEGCVFNAFTGGAIRIEGAESSLYMRDCIWRNGVWPSHMFVGQQVTLPALPVDSLVVTNNTYFNNNSFWLFQENGLARYAVIEHNTVFTSLIDMMRMRFTSNALLRSNLFYGTHAYGDSQEARDGSWYEPDGSPYSIISLYEVPSDILDEVGIAEEDRVVHLTHNAYFSPEPIVGYWNANDDIFGVTWMNARTQGLFDSHDYFYEHDNLEANPSFTDTDMDQWIVNAVADFCITYRATATNGPLSGDAGSNRNYDELQSVDILIGIQWPLPEYLAYENQMLLTGGHDGLPIGDLNWFPDLRDQYEEPGSIPTGIEEPLLPEHDAFALDQNFPNPFSAKTTIKFNIPQRTIVTLKVYDMLGREVSVLVNDNLQAGSYRFELDAKGMEEGTYYYLLKAGDYLGQKKMILVK